MSKSRPVSKFKSYTHQAICDYSKGITVALTGNLLLNLPPISVLQQSTDNDALQAAIIAWGVPRNQGSEAQLTALLAARNVVEDNISILNDYVASVANGDKGIVQSAGMVPSVDPSPIGPLPAPQGLHDANVKNEAHPGDMRMRWTRVKGAKSYNVYASATVDGPFVFLGNTTKTLWIATSAPGRLSFYQVSALGAAGLSPASVAVGMHSAF